MNALLSASPQAVPVILEHLAPVYEQIVPELRDLSRRADLSEEKRTRVSLALLESDHEQLEYLRRRLLECDVEEFLLIRQMLRTFSKNFTHYLWELASNEGKMTPRRFRAACALALYDAENPKWKTINADVADHLASQNALLAGRWMEALRPARNHLIDPLMEIYRHWSEEQAARRILATNILADYAADQPKVLTALLLEADAQQFEMLFPHIETHAKQTISLFERRLDGTLGQPQEELSASDIHTAANAAVALLRLGRENKIWPLLQGGPDPRLRSHLIHRFPSHGVESEKLVSQIKRRHNAAIRQAVILSLGGYESSSLHVKEQQAVEKMLLDLYQTDPDPGVHAAIAWLLRRRGKQNELAKIDGAFEPGQIEANRRWFINSQGQHYALIQGGVFLMGSPEDEFGRRADEPRHYREIDHTLAVAMEEVTVAQFQRFLQDTPDNEHTYSEAHSPEKNCPQTSVTWYEAAAYCNWLSEQEGIPKSQWCFLPNDQGRFAAGMRLADGYTHRKGYRLPTEAEWEYACRGGAQTARCYGETEKLLGHYAWYLANALDRSWPVGSKMPNLYGLFDVHGNVWEWCAEKPQDYPLEASAPMTLKTAAPNEVSDAGPIVDGQPRALRGGSYFYHYIYTRSALRNKEPADARYYGIGLRPVRTIRNTLTSDNEDM